MFGFDAFAFHVIYYEMYEYLYSVAEDLILAHCRFIQPQLLPPVFG